VQLANGLVPDPLRSIGQHCNSKQRGSVTSPAASRQSPGKKRCKIWGEKKYIFSCVLQATAVAAVSGMERELTGWFVRRESDVARAVASAFRCLVSLERAITRLPSKNVHQTVLGAGAFIRLTSKLMFMFLLSYDGPLPLW